MPGLRRPGQGRRIPPKRRHIHQQESPRRLPINKRQTESNRPGLDPNILERRTDSLQVKQYKLPHRPGHNHCKLAVAKGYKDHSEGDADA